MSYAVLNFVMLAPQVASLLSHLTLIVAFKESRHVWRLHRKRACATHNCYETKLSSNLATAYRLLSFCVKLFFRFSVFNCMFFYVVLIFGFSLFFLSLFCFFLLCRTQFRCYGSYAWERYHRRRLLNGANNISFKLNFKKNNTKTI